MTLGFRLFRCDQPKLLDGAADQARDLYLGQAHDLGDLGLLPVLAVTHLEDQPIARRQDSHQGVEQVRIIDARVPGSSAATSRRSHPRVRGCSATASL